MTKFQRVNKNLSNLQLDKFKSVRTNETGILSKLSSNAIGDASDESNYSHKLLITPYLLI